MKTLLLLLAVAVTLPAIMAPTLEAQDAATPRRETAPVVKPGKLPEVPHGPWPEVTEERTAQIREWIDLLTDVDGPGYGYSSTLSGSVFAPQPESAKAGMLLLTDHALKASQALLHLVEAGPDAMPLLLEKLDDAAPTKYTVEHEVGFGGMWYSTEMRVNPANPLEKAPPVTEGANLTTYTVKLGDLCLVALGQITGRGYSAIRYQPTACVVINSPVESRGLRAAVRAIWTSPDAREKLWQSLLFDHATEGIESSKGGWLRAGELRVEAARRLAYYFPDESAELLAERIRGLDLKRGADEEDPETWKRREARNGGGAEEFLKALGTAKAPAVRAALLEAARQTDDPGLFIALLPVVIQEDRPLASERLRGYLAELPPFEEGPYGEGYKLLTALLKAEEEKSGDAFRSYLKDAGSQRRHSVCAVFERGGPAWAEEILRPLLDDRSASEWGGKYRICDAAAVALVAIREGLAFNPRASRKERDEAIRAIKAALNP